MSIERWGSLSVPDHTDTAALAVNVLLYDRLVLPVMTPQAEHNEREYWLEHGWDPDLQSKRLDDLEELAVRRPWDAERRQQFKDRMAEIRAEAYDTQHVDAFDVSRMILAHEQVADRPPGVNHVDVIPAYNSAAALTRDFQLTNVKENVAAQAILLTRKLALPALDNPEDALMLARDLSRDREFRKKRSALFEWQQEAARRGIGPEAAVAELAQMTHDYNDAVKAATKKVYWKFAFTLFGIGLGCVLGTDLAWAGTAALSLVTFAMFDKEPAIEAGQTAPAAMFHDLEARVGYKLA